MDTTFDPVLNKPPCVEVAADWFASRGVCDTTHAIDEHDGVVRHLVRGWFYHGARTDAHKGILAAKVLGFYVDSFYDDGDWALVVDAHKVPTTAIPRPDDVPWG